MMFSTGSEIHGQVIESTNNRREFDVIKNESRITGVDYNPKSGMLFLADSQSHQIKRSFIPGSTDHPEAKIGSSQVIISMTSDRSEPTSVASDWLSNNIYWTETRGARGYVMMAKEDGRYRRSLVTSNLERPTSIALDPEHGLMFWADAGNNPKIETGWMDGTRRKVIVSQGIGSPEAITIDFAMGHTLYWVDSKLEIIEMMDKDGQNR